ILRAQAGAARLRRRHTVISAAAAAVVVLAAAAAVPIVGRLHDTRSSAAAQYPHRTPTQFTLELVSPTDTVTDLTSIGATQLMTFRAKEPDATGLFRGS